MKFRLVESGKRQLINFWSGVTPSTGLYTEDDRLEHTTKAVFLVIGFSLIISTLAVTYLDLTSAKLQIWPIFMLLGMVVIHFSAWRLVTSGYWKIARYIPTLLFLFAGTALTSQVTLQTIAVLQYVMCIIVASILFAPPAQWGAVALSSVFYLFILWQSKVPVDDFYFNIKYINVVMFGAIGVVQQITTSIISKNIENLIHETEVRKRSEESSHQKERLLNATAKAAGLLLEVQDWELKILEMLALLGKATGASHSYLFQNHADQNGALLSSMKYEWTDMESAFPSDLNAFQNIPVLEEDMIDWYNILITGQPFYDSTEDFPDEWGNLEYRKQIKTLLDVPIFVDGTWWGVIGFDDCVRVKPWSQSDVDSLQIAAGLLGSAIKRKNSIDELTASEEKFQKAFHETFVPMVIGRLSDRIILDTNEAFSKLTGYSRAELVNRWASEFNFWFNVSDYEHYRKTIGEKGFIHEFKTHIRKRNGEAGVVLLSVTAIRIDSQDCLLYTMYEITGLERALTELQDKNNELERFTYTVSHDLKAPLITIGGFTGMLEKDILDGKPDRVPHNVKRIQEAVLKMERLLNELLELSRIGRIINEPVRVPFQELAHEALNILHGRLTMNNIKVVVEENLSHVKVDRARMIEVIQNLVDNAAKFMGAQPNPEIRIGSRRGMEQRIFYVSDNGIGVEPKYHERVFGLFNKLDANSEGTGIGLALVKRIIEYHGGRIWVESEGINMGTSFCFTLPGS